MNIKNFTPVLDVLVKMKGRDYAYLFGLMWRYAQGKDGVCRLSQLTLNELSGIDIERIRTMQDDMCEIGLATLRTKPGQRNRPRIFDVADIKMVSQLEMVPEISDLGRGFSGSWSGFSANELPENSDEETIEKEEKEEKDTFLELLKSMVSPEEIEKADKVERLLSLLETGFKLKLGRNSTEVTKLAHFLAKEEEEGYTVGNFVRWMYKHKISDKFDPTESWNGKNIYERVTSSYWPKFKAEQKPKGDAQEYHGRVL